MALRATVALAGRTTRSCAGLRRSAVERRGLLRGLSGTSGRDEQPKKTEPRTASEHVEAAQAKMGERVEAVQARMEERVEAAQAKVGEAQVKVGEAQAKATNKVRELVSNYGVVGVSVYGGIYVGTLALIFGLVENDVLRAGDALSALRYTGLNEYLDTSQVSPKAGNFALAWILTKFTEPLRLVAAVGVTPPLARALGYAPKHQPQSPPQSPPPQDKQQ